MIKNQRSQHPMHTISLRQLIFESTKKSIQVLSQVLHHLTKWRPAIWRVDEASCQWVEQSRSEAGSMVWRTSVWTFQLQRWEKKYANEMIKWFWAKARYHDSHPEGQDGPKKDEEAEVILWSVLFAFKSFTAGRVWRWSSSCWRTCKEETKSSIQSFWIKSSCWTQQAIQTSTRTKAEGHSKQATIRLDNEKEATEAFCITEIICCYCNLKQLMKLMNRKCSMCLLSQNCDSFGIHRLCLQSLVVSEPTCCTVFLSLQNSGNRDQDESGNHATAPQLWCFGLGDFALLRKIS